MEYVDGYNKNKDEYQNIHW